MENVIKNFDAGTARDRLSTPLKQGIAPARHGAEVPAEKRPGQKSPTLLEKPLPIWADKKPAEVSATDDLHLRSESTPLTARSVAHPTTSDKDRITDALLVKKMTVQLLLEDFKTLADSIGSLPRSAKEHINVMNQIFKVERLIRDAGKKLNDPYSAKFAKTMFKAAADMEKPCRFLSTRYSSLAMDGQERSDHIISLAIAIFEKIGGLAVKGARFQSAEPLLATKCRPIKLDTSPSPNDSQAQRILAHRQSRRDIASSNIESVRNADQGTARAIRPAAPLDPAASSPATAAGSQYTAPLPAPPRQTPLTPTGTVPETDLPSVSRFSRPGVIRKPYLPPTDSVQGRPATDSVNAAKGNARDPLPAFASGRKTSSVQLKEKGDPENDASGSSPGEANNLDAMLHQFRNIVDAKLRKASDARSKFVSARKTSGEQSEEDLASGTDASSHSDTEKLNALLDELEMLGELEKLE